MRIGKKLALMGITLTSAMLLAACGSSDAKNATNVYSYIYGTDPESLDYIATGRSSTSNITANLIDGLLEYDNEGNLVPSLAKSWEVSSDGLTYTYKLRDDAKWYSSDGEEYAGVTAHDFVTGLKHAADSEASGLYIVENSIKGLAAYVSGENRDFSSVGIKALDDYTIQYTLNKPEPYWNSKTTTATMMPVNEEFLTSKGKDFGKPETDGILYNGPFLLKSLTPKSSIEFSKNEDYYDKDNVYLDTVKLSYMQGKSSELEGLAKNFEEGVYTSAALYPNSATYAEVEKKFKDNIVYAPQGGTTYYYTFNLNRTNFNNTSKNDAQKESTKKAVLNKDFRQAISFAFNRESYNAQSVGESGASKNLRNTMVPPTFVQTEDGRDFGEIVSKELLNYGDEWSGVQLADAQNGLYNPDKAKAEFAKAKESLQAEGVEFPIHLDVLAEQSSEDGVRQTSSLKQSIEETLGKENVVIDIHKVKTEEFDNATYFAESGSQQDWDITSNGWGPDYTDPSTYLDIFKPSNGAAVLKLGIEPGKENANVALVGLDTYEQMLNQANEVTDVTTRYEKYAAAQAWLTDSSLTIPTSSDGADPRLSRKVPFSGAFSYGVGVKDERTYKYLKVQDKPVTVKEYEAAQKEWEEKRSKK